VEKKKEQKNKRKATGKSIPKRHGIRNTWNADITVPHNPDGSNYDDSIFPVSYLNPENQKPPIEYTT
jgi:hypothetical protein